MKGFNAISRLTLSAIMVCVVSFAFAQSTPSTTPSAMSTIQAGAHLETLLDIKVTGDEVKFHIDTKDKYKKGLEAAGTTVEICATCDWKLSYDVTGASVVDLGNGKFKVADMDGKHFIPSKLIGMMIKPANSTFYSENIRNNYANTKALKKWDWMLKPRNNKSNIGEESDTKFEIWWSLGQSWTGTNLLDEQIHAGWYNFDVKLTLSCIH